MTYALRSLVALVATFVTLAATTAEARPRHLADPLLYGNITMLPHPRGCPGNLFCGCGASVRICGRPVRTLYLSSAWLKFSRASPAPHMAAVRPSGCARIANKRSRCHHGHVMVLESHISGPYWMVYDANSGRHGTRLHARSIAGYVIVNPRCG